jgi:hypothetical protein
LSEVHESEINVKIADVLSRELGFDIRSERIEKRKRPDLKCYYKGFKIVIEASYDKRDAEKDAERRISEESADIAIALWIKEKFKDTPQSGLYEAVKKARYDIKMFVPREELKYSLLRFIRSEILPKAKPVTDWIEDIDLPTLKAIIEVSVEYMIREEEIEKHLGEIESKIQDFIKTLSDVDRALQGKIQEPIYRVLYKLYGLEIARKDPEVAFGHAGLSILLSTVFYEHVRAQHQLDPISIYIEKFGAIEGLRRALQDLLEVDYREAIELTLEVLSVLPVQATRVVEKLVELAIKIASNHDLLKKDFAGRLYHRITGNIAVRKNFATFYTEVPAAYLLSMLTVLSLFELDVKESSKISKDEARKIIDKIKHIKVGDFACGSGTLLTATYNTLMHLAGILKFYHGLHDVDLEEVNRKLVEEGIYGIDALRYASQITAINLALMAPGNLSRVNSHTIYLGYIPEEKRVWLGSLEILTNPTKIGKILEFVKEGKSYKEGAVAKITLEGSIGEFNIPDEYDIIVMNPPFTRATGRTEEFSKESEERGLFGFVTDKEVREIILKQYRKLRDEVRRRLIEIATAYKNIYPQTVQEIISGNQELSSYLNIGQAGEGLLFIYLAYSLIKSNGTIAFVLPRNLLMGVSWFLARVLLTTKFHVKYIIISSDPEKGYNFSESTQLSEVLIVAKRIDKHSDEEETILVNLLRKPRTSVEAIVLAEEIAKSKGGYIKLGKSGAEAYIVKVHRKELLEHILNWNILFHEKLHEIYDEMGKHKVQLKGILFKTPLTLLKELIVDMGVNRGGDIIEAFNLRKRGSRVDCEGYVVKPSVPYIPMLCGTDEDVVKTMLIKPNAYVPDSNSVKAKRIKELRSRLFLPNRTRWTTRHAIAIKTTEEAIANVYFMTKTSLDEDGEKALALWLNSFFGVLTILAHMEITEEAYTRLNIAQWKILPILDVKSIGEDAVKCLARVFDEYARRDLGRIPEQFEKETRLELDLEVLECLSTQPLSNEQLTALRGELRELYKQFCTVFKQMSRQKG